jgi:hypothetical protein
MLTLLVFGLAIGVLGLVLGSLIALPFMLLGFVFKLLFLPFILIGFVFKLIFLPFRLVFGLGGWLLGSLFGMLIIPLVVLIAVVAVIGAVASALLSLLAPLVPLALLGLLVWGVYRIATRPSIA